MLSSVLPNHVAIIMDGNGRWASQRHLPRTEGHKVGVKTAKAIVEHSASLGVKYLSLYVFSTENWKRSKTEVDFLFNLAESCFDDLLKILIDNNIKAVVSGILNALPISLQNCLNSLVDETSNNSGMCLNICINYGGRQEIVNAVNKIVESGNAVTEQSIMQNLYNNLPEPDMIIRTGGEKRLSNFLLYQSAYSELFFTDTLWPDFNAEEYENMLCDFAKRNRNFGAVKE